MTRARAGGDPARGGARGLGARARRDDGRSRHRPRRDRARASSDGDPASVVRIGSLGKTVWGGLRVGWIRAEGDLVRRLVAARPAHDLGTPEFEQAVATALLARLRRDHRAALAPCCARGATRSSTRSRRQLPEWRVPHVHGGVSLWIELDAALSSALVMDVRSTACCSRRDRGSRWRADTTVICASRSPRRRTS